MNRYYWSFEEEEEVWYNSFQTVKECIEDARYKKRENGYEYDNVFVGEIEKHIPGIDAERLIDDARVRAQFGFGDSSDGWLDSVKREDEEILEKRLNEVFLNWLKETKNEVNFGRFKEVTCYDIETGEIVPYRKL